VQRGQFATSPCSTRARNRIRFNPPASIWRETWEDRPSLPVVDRMRTTDVPRQLPHFDLPPTSELCSKVALVERHPNLLTHCRVQWALRNRATNGLASVVYETRSGQLLVHEPEFLRWYLGLTGRSKPRASRTRPRSAESYRGQNGKSDEHQPEATIPREWRRPHAE